MAVNPKYIKEIEEKVENKFKGEVQKYGKQKVLLYSMIGAFVAYIILHSLLEH